MPDTKINMELCGKYKYSILFIKMQGGGRDIFIKKLKK